MKNSGFSNELRGDRQYAWNEYTYKLYADGKLFYSYNIEKFNEKTFATIKNIPLSHVISYDLCKPYVISQSELLSYTAFNIKLPNYSFELSGKFKYTNALFDTSVNYDLTISSTDNKINQYFIYCKYTWSGKWKVEENNNYYCTLNFPYILTNDLSFLQMFYNPGLTMADNAKTVGTATIVRVHSFQPRLSSVKIATNQFN